MRLSGQAKKITTHSTRVILSLSRNVLAVEETTNTFHEKDLLISIIDRVAVSTVQVAVSTVQVTVSTVRLSCTLQVYVAHQCFSQPG